MYPVRCRRRNPFCVSCSTQASGGRLPGLGVGSIGSSPRRRGTTVRCHIAGGAVGRWVRRVGRGFRQTARPCRWGRGGSGNVALVVGGCVYWKVVWWGAEEGCWGVRFASGLFSPWVWAWGVRTTCVVGVVGPRRRQRTCANGILVCALSCGPCLFLRSVLVSLFSSYFILSPFAFAFISALSLFRVQHVAVGDARSGKCRRVLVEGARVIIKERKRLVGGASRLCTVVNERGLAEYGGRPMYLID